MRAKHAYLVSGVLKLRQKPLNFMSGAVYRRTICCVAAGTGAKLCEKIVHGSLSLNAHGPFPISGPMAKSNFAECWSEWQDLKPATPVVSSAVRDQTALYSLLVA